MTTNLTAAKNASASLKSTLLGLAGAVGVGFGLHAVYEKIKSANMEMMGLQKRVTGTHFAFTQWGKDVSTTDRMKESMAVAAEMGGKLETVARHLHLELDPVATIYNSMAASAGKLGMSQEDTLKLVEQLAAATRVYGSDAQTVAMTVSRALETGGIRGVDNFAKMLRQKLNLKEEGKGLAPAEMLRRLSSGLGGTVEAAQMMGGGLEGTMADIHRESDALVRLLTGPAFKSVATMMHQWVEYSAKNREHVEAIAKSVAGGLVTGLTVVKDITVFIYDHWKALALIYAGFKIPGMVAGFTGGLAGGLGGVGGAAMAGGTIGPWGAAIASAGTMLAAVITDAIKRGEMQASHDEKMASVYGVGVKGGTIDAFIAANEQYRNAKTDQERYAASRLIRVFGKNQDIANGDQLESAAGNWSADQRTRMAKAMGMKGGEGSWAAMRLDYGRTSAEDLKAAIDGSKLVSILQYAIPYNMMDDIHQFRMTGVKDSPEGTGKKADVKVTINRIEVVSDDPDRFAFGLDELVQTATSRRGITPGYLPNHWQRG